MVISKIKIPRYEFQFEDVNIKQMQKFIYHEVFNIGWKMRYKIIRGVGLEKESFVKRKIKDTREISVETNRIVPDYYVIRPLIWQ